jgi:hypothetical protein
MTRRQVCSPLSFFVSVRSLSLLLSLPFDAAARLSGLSLPPPRRRPLSVFSLSAPPSLVVFTSALDDTLTLSALIVGAHGLFMTCHAILSCRTSVAFVYHSVCSELGLGKASFYHEEDA